jgi:hypothetical protein
MNFKKQKNVTIKVYLNQINGCLFLNGRLIKKKSNKLLIFNNLLNSLEVSVNILSNKKGKRNIILTNKLLLGISKKILKIKKNEQKILIKDINHNGNNNNNNKLESRNKKLFNFSAPIIILLTILFIIFLLDYKTTVAKMNESNILEMKEIENQYKINKCEINGNLPSLKPKCEEMLNKIEILKNKKMNILSVFSTWTLDVIFSAIKAYDIKNIAIISLLFSVIYRLFR